MANMKNKDKFLKSALEKHGNKFDYSHIEYINNKQKILIICPEHGKFYQTPDGHLRTYGCSKCSNIIRGKTRSFPVKVFLSRVIKKYNNKYEYPDIESYYECHKTKINILCKKHGLFKKTAEKHLYGQACYQCKLAECNNKGGYNSQFFIDNPTECSKKACIYYVKIDKFYKIGITTDFQSRLTSLRSLARKNHLNDDIKIIKFKTLTLYEAFIKEQTILHLNKELRVYRKWSTEIFLNDINPNFD